jgi:hypothetical protein
MSELCDTELRANPQKGGTHLAARSEEALEELEALQIACADAVNGQALFPFMHGKKPAWLVFNLFEGEPLRFWRYQEDEPDVRRPVSALEEAAGEGKHLA